MRCSVGAVHQISNTASQPELAILFGLSYLGVVCCGMCKGLSGSRGDIEKAFTRLLGRLYENFHHPENEPQESIA